MGTFWRYFYAALAILATATLFVIAYKLIGGQLTNAGGSRSVAIDYTNLVVILLTTVTVLFTVCALALAVLGIIGFRSLKEDLRRRRRSPPFHLPSTREAKRSLRYKTSLPRKMVI